MGMAIMKQIDPNNAIEYMIKNAKAYAEAKANVAYLTEYRKSKKAMLFASAVGNTVTDRENKAYSHPEYIELLEGLREAVEKAEELRWMLIAAQARLDIYRTQEASNRAIDRNTN